MNGVIGGPGQKGRDFKPGEKGGAGGGGGGQGKGRPGKVRKGLGQNLQVTAGRKPKMWELLKKRPFLKQDEAKLHVQNEEDLSENYKKKRGGEKSQAGNA